MGIGQLAKAVQVVLPVAGTEKYRITVIATLGDVVWHPWEHDSGTPRHASTLAGRWPPRSADF
jgi:hypothetical protein